jgi:hypothetical protein
MALLTFKQFAAGESAGATVAGGKLDALRQGEQTLGISVTPDDGLAIDGPHAGSAQFRDGELLQAVPFALRALPESAGEYGVHVEFHHAGARLYEFRLPIIVLPLGKALPAVVAPLAIDLDARQAVQAAGEVGKSPRRFRLKACFENNLLYLNFDDYVDGEINCFDRRLRVCRSTVPVSTPCAGSWRRPSTPISTRVPRCGTHSTEPTPPRPASGAS